MAYRNRISLLIGLALPFLGSSVLRADPNLIVDIEEATTPPAIDGELSDWADARWIRFAPGAPQMSSVNVLADDGATEPWGTAGTAADLSGSFSFQWDEDWLYLAAQVTDNVHDVSEGAGSLWFLKDSVSLFLDIPLDGDGEAWIAGDHSFSLVADPTYPENGKWWRHGEETGQKEVPAPPKTRLAVRLGERGNYTLEAAIPIAALTQITPDFHPPFENRMVGFLLLVTDPDQGPNPWGGQLSYGGDGNNDSNWSRLRFAPARRAPAATGTVSGKVSYEYDGAPWAGGRVQVKDQEGKLASEAGTSAEGQYQIQVGLGDYQLSAGSRVSKIKVEQGAPLKVDLVVPPTLARLSFWVPSAHQAKFAALYEGQVLPLLKKHGLVEYPAQARATADSIFSKLFAVPLPSEVIWRWAEVQTDPAWWSALQEISRSTGAAHPLHAGFQLYEAPAGSGTQVRSGPGKAKEGKGKAVNTGPGVKQGDWLNLGVADGLPNAPITAVLQDRKGNLWLGTDGRGVCRYDGQEWTSFTVEDGLANNWVSAVVEDQEGNLWFGSWGGGQWQTGGVSRYNGREFRTFTVQDGLPASQVVSLLVDRQGNLWAGTWGGLCRYDGQRWTTFTTEDGLPSNLVGSMKEDRQGKLWFGTLGGGLCRYDGEKFTSFRAEDGLGSNYVGSILEDRQGTLWVGTGDFNFFTGEWSGRGGVSWYDGRRFVPLVFPDTLASVVSMAEDPEGDLWFGTAGGGLWRCDGQGCAHFTPAEGLPGNEVLSSAVDREGSLWFGSETALSRYEGAQLRNFMVQDGLAHNGVWSMHEDRQGSLWFGTGGGNRWFGTEGGGVSRYDGQGFKTFTTRDGLGNNRVSSMVEDQQGALWFSTGTLNSAGGGVSRYDGQRFETFTTEQGLAGNVVLSSALDREGKLWFGTGGGGVSRYDGQQWRSGPAALADLRFKTFTTTDGLVNPIVASIFADNTGRLWFGTAGGVSRYDGQQWVSFTSKDGLPAGGVSTIAEDRQGRLWFGTSGGVSRYDGKGFKTFTVEDGLADNGVGAILEDQEGRLWFGTRGGVSRYDGRVFQTLLVQDGLAGSQVNDLLQRRNGEIWMATDQGVTRYRPSHTPPLIHLKNVVADHPYGPVEELSLPSSQEFLAFEFQGISLKTRPGQLVYLYRLEGYDQDWRQTRQNRAEYANLPTGEYVFQVKAVDRDLNYSEQAAEVKVEIHPPYGRLAAIGLIGMLGLVVVWQAGRLVQRDHKLRESNSALSDANRELFRTLQEKEQAQELLVRSENMAAIGTLVAGVAHELNNPLGAAYSLVQTVQEMVEEDTAEQLQQEKEEIVGHLAFSRKELNRAKEIVAALLGLSRQNQDYTEAVEINTVVQDALRVLYNQYKKYDLNLVEEYAEGLPVVQGNFAQLGQVCMNLIKNAIEALKGQEGQIALRTYREGEQVVFECADTGPGIPQEAKQRIFQPFFTTKAPGEGTGLGLYICHQTVEKHRGSIEVDSEVGKGTRFRVRLPAGKI